MFTCAVIDTETTGLPKCPSYCVYPDPRDLQAYERARLLRLTIGEYAQETKKLIEMHDFYVLPDATVLAQIGPDTVKYNGITREIALAKGRPLAEVAEKLAKILSNPAVACTVYHNSGFDVAIIKSEMHRLETPSATVVSKCLGEIPVICTMRCSRDVCELPTLYGTKYKDPKLIEAYNFLTSQNLPDIKTHDSTNDVAMTAACYFALYDRNLVTAV